MPQKLFRQGMRGAACCHSFYLSVFFQDAVTHFIGGMFWSLAVNVFRTALVAVQKGHTGPEVRAAGADIQPGYIGLPRVEYRVKQFTNLCF